MRILRASSEIDYLHAAELFREYAGSLEIDLCFQNFEQELRVLPAMYGPPHGCLLLAYEGEHPVGCVALRRMDDSICEMKRLYLRPGFRRKGLGRVLAVQIVKHAAEIGYHRMRLDTLSSMQAALSLYESMGFKRIQPYYHNPDARAVFMELGLEVLELPDADASGG